MAAQWGWESGCHYKLMGVKLALPPSGSHWGCTYSPGAPCPLGVLVAGWPAGSGRGAHGTPVPWQGGDNS